MTRWRHVLCCAVMAGLSACSGGSDADVDALTRIRAESTIRVGFANEAPYAYLDSRSDSLMGEAPAVARIVLDGLGVDRVEGVLAEFGALIPGLKAGRFDVIAAGMYVLPERCNEVDFSEPTYCIGEAFLVAADNPEELHSYEDVANNADATLGVVAGAVELGYARALGVPNDRIVIFPDAPSAVAGLQTGRVDAYAGTEMTIQDLLAKADDPGLESADPFTQPVIDGRPAVGCGAFAFRPDDDSLKDAFNGELQTLLGSEQHLNAVKSFGFTATELPGEITTAQLCHTAR